MRSSSSSIFAVNRVSKTFGKCLTSLSVTTMPRSVGWNERFCCSTYLRSWMVLMMLAYVLGRPMFSASSALTSEASVNRGGG